jgi:hypothetical protein
MYGVHIDTLLVGICHFVPNSAWLFLRFWEYRYLIPKNIRIEFIN